MITPPGVFRVPGDFRALLGLEQNTCWVSLSKWPYRVRTQPALMRWGGRSCVPLAAASVLCWKRAVNHPFLKLHLSIQGCC
jgi:hypothetical protein